MGKGSTAPAGPNPERVHDRSDLARELDLLRTRAALGTRKPRVSLAELAVRIGEPRSTVHAYVAGRHLPGSEVLDRIVIALGATAEEQRAWNEAWFRVAARREVSPSAAGHDEVVPHQLVPDVDTFTGRAAELAELDRRLDAAAGADPAQVISALAGTGGVGKSALAAHWAHRVAAAFPDGQLWVNLRGFDPDQPLSPDAALAALLHALGVADAEIPTDVEERAARYRSLVADRRLLVVLDNARDTEQVRLLLPGTPSCFVIVTSRDSLVGLVARHGAHRIDLDGLPEPDAIDLVDRLVGERAGREPAAARRLIRRCGRLPLALRIAAELAVRRPAIPLAGLADELADEHRLLDLLDAGGDPRTSMRAVLSWSYRHCGTAEARVFRLLGLHPGLDVDAAAVAALADVECNEAARLLDVLAAAHLVSQPRPGRYAQHDVLRSWAAERCAALETAAQRRAALDRLFHHVVHTAARAMDLVYPDERPPRPEVPAPERVTLELADPEGARRWLDVERPTLVALAALPALGRDAVALSLVVKKDLAFRGHHHDAASVHRHALTQARAYGDPVEIARVLVALGCAQQRAGRYDAAETSLREAFALARVHGDRPWEAHTALNLGITVSHRDRAENAATWYRHALAIFREMGDRRMEAGLLLNLGVLHQSAGCPEAAGEAYHQALAVARTITDPDLETLALNNLGDSFRLRGDHERAGQSYRSALALCRTTGDDRRAAMVVSNLGELAHDVGRHAAAIRHYRVALRMYRRQGARRGQAQILERLGRSSRALGRRSDAERHYREALLLFDAMGLAEADEVRASLAGVPPASGPGPSSPPV